MRETHYNRNAGNTGKGKADAWGNIAIYALFFLAITVFLATTHYHTTLNFINPATKAVLIAQFSIVLNHDVTNGNSNTI